MHSSSKPPTQRSLKVGETIRQALAEIFMRGEAHVPELEGASITVSEVKVAPDLKNATVFVMPLGGQNKEKVLKTLNDSNSYIRNILRRKVILKYFPRIIYKLDESFEEAGRVNQLLQDPRVRKDVFIQNGEEPAEE